MGTWDGLMDFEGKTYLIVNKLNGKGYVGQTATSVKKRWKGHLYDAHCGKGYAFENAIRFVIRTYGWNKVEDYFEVHEMSTSSSQSELDASEKHWISLLDTMAHEGWGYNLLDGGYGGGRPGIASRANMSAARRRRPLPSPETKLRQSESMTQRWLDPDYKAHQRAAYLEAYSHPEVVARRNEGTRLRWKRPEEIESRRQISKSLWLRSGFRDSQQVGLIARFSDPAVRARQSAAQKARRTREVEGLWNGSAQFSSDPEQAYRYRLTREWDADLPTVNFVGLSPATADADTDDPMVRRCIGFARRWGFGSLVITNLFAWRTTNPVRMREYLESVGLENDMHLREAAENAQQVVVCWGDGGKHLERWRQVQRVLDMPVVCLGVTKSRQPKPPLYLANATHLEAFMWPEA